MNIDTVFTLTMGIIGALSGIAGWLFGRRKYNADSYLQEIKGMKETLSFNQQVTHELRETLDQYIDQARNNSAEIYRLKKLVDILMGNTCLQKDCPRRVFYSDEQLSNILGGSKE